MEEFKKFIILNKLYQVSSDSSNVHQTQTAKTFLNCNDSASPSSVSVYLISATESTTTKPPSILVGLPIPLKRFKLQSHSTRNGALTIEGVLPRAAKLFMVNYYFKLEYKHRSKEELLEIADTIQISVTIEDVRFMEEITRDRNNWYSEKLRAGRVTCSQFKSICEANVSAPDLNLLTEICYPEKCVRAPHAHDETERVATLSFICQMKKFHANFNYKTVGLIIDQNCPYFAATTGGVCSCDCCGEYVVEIKCPFGNDTTNVAIENLVQMDDPFMEMRNGAHCLRKDHRYYYQLQMQMALHQTRCAWFYIWSTRFRITNRIWFNSTFWQEKSQRALNFAKEVLSVELMSSYYTHTY